MQGEPKPTQLSEDASIEDLLGRVVGDARELAEAEIQLIKAKTLSEMKDYRSPVILLVLATLFFVSAVTTLCVTLALALATLIGPLAGGLVATAIALGIAGLLALLGKSQLRKLI